MIRSVESIAGIQSIHKDINTMLYEIVDCGG